MNSESNCYKDSCNGLGSNPTNNAAPSLKQAAFEYWEKGLYIVPLKWVKTAGGELKVQPLIEWRDWEQNRQSLQDFEALPWREAEGFGLIGGDKLSNGLYLGALDFDKHNTTREAQEIGERVLREMPVTQIEKTRRGGQHWIYHSHRQPRTVDSYRDKCALELLGRGRLIIMAPSAGYKRLNDNMPTVIQSLESMFLETLHKTGVHLKSEEPKREDKREAPSTRTEGETHRVYEGC